MRRIHSLGFLCTFGPSLGYHVDNKIQQYPLSPPFPSLLYIYSKISPPLPPHAAYSHALSLFFLYSCIYIFPSILGSCLVLKSSERRIMGHVDHHQFPCLHCHPQSYIRMVQHLIERCLLLRMTREDCVQALAKYASIRPTITLTVWEELMKENRAFFREYFQSISPRPYFQPRRSSAYGHLQRRVSVFQGRKLWK